MPLSKADMCPYTYVTRTQAQNLAKSLSNSKSYTSSLMFGVQWDLVLAFMSKDTAHINDTNILTSNSTTIGNYYNNLWTITNQKAKYIINSNSKFTVYPIPFKKESDGSILLTTGADKNFSAQNIYDIAGSAWEHTLEGVYSDNNFCVVRGGSCSNVGNSYPANSRFNLAGTYNDSTLSFRVSIFKI